MQNLDNREIEVRFLNVDVSDLKSKLLNLGAKDLGEDLLTEYILEDIDLKWRESNRFIRLRSTRNGKLLSFKQHHEKGAYSTEEIEFGISDIEKATQVLNKLGLIVVRMQEKKRHTFEFKNVVIDIDTWPKIPPYVELEGQSEEDLKEMASLLGFNWSDAIFENAKIVIEKYYNFPLKSLKSFTFDKIE